MSQRDVEGYSDQQIVQVSSILYSFPGSVLAVLAKADIESFLYSLPFQEISWQKNDALPALIVTLL